MQKSPVTALLVPVALVALAACGGGSPTASQGAGLRFIPESGAGGNAVTLSTPLAGRNLLLVEVNVIEVENLHTVRFELTYPAGILALNGASEAEFLSTSAGDPVTFISDGSAGTLSVTLRRARGAAGVSGSGRLATIGFQVIGEGTGDLVFQQTRATDTDGIDLPGVVWLGGRVENDF